MKSLTTKSFAQINNYKWPNVFNTKMHKMIYLIIISICQKHGNRWSKNRPSKLTFQKGHYIVYLDILHLHSKKPTLISCLEITGIRLHSLCHERALKLNSIFAPLNLVQTQTWFNRYIYMHNGKQLEYLISFN